MGINIIKGEIKIIIETLSEQYNLINQQSGRIPQIELDIIMANIRKLYERFSDLNKLNSLEVKDIAEENLEAIPEKEKALFVEKNELEIIETISSEVNLENTKEIIFEQPEVQKEEDRASEVVEKMKELPAIEVRPAKSGKKNSVDLFSQAEKETLADKFKETQISMHDKIATEKPDKTLADKIGKSNIINLKNAIGINDKFLFINELFKGDIQEYNKTIDKLNSYAVPEECMGFLEELKEKFKWGEKPDAYQKLIDLLIRRFL